MDATSTSGGLFAVASRRFSRRLAFTSSRCVSLYFLRRSAAFSGCAASYARSDFRLLCVRFANFAATTGNAAAAASNSRNRAAEIVTGSSLTSVVTADIFLLFIHTL